MANNNGRKIFYTIISAVVTLIVGFSLFAGKIIVNNNRENGEQDVKIKINREDIKKNSEAIEEVRDGVQRLEVGQEVLIEKFKLEKEYREKLNEKEEKIPD